jgi:hypothetical protein
VKKLEKGRTKACTKRHQKDVPGATMKKQPNDMNKGKGNISTIHIVCTNDISMTSKTRKRMINEKFFRCNEKGHFFASCPCNQERASPRITTTKKKNKQQAPSKTEHHTCYNFGERGHLKKVCSNGKDPKLNNSFHSYSLRRPKYYTCARTMTSSPRFITNAIGVPKTPLANLDGHISRWLTKCAN